jgi:asparagine synthase (glutamine-hydrolysing)
MCGIAGLVSLDGSGPDLGVLRRMNEAAAHRGPDGSGLVARGAVAFAHRRLAIVGLGPDGAQPMVSADGRLAVTYNGEIYNWIELREELRGLGHRFRGDCDTEVLLAAYAEWGPRCVDRFNGMWAFAVHDARAGTVFLSRDRFGVKPLYFARLKGRVAFASEIRQLLPLLSAVRANRRTVEEFLFLGIDEPPVRTFFEGVEKLQGGHSMTIDIDAGTVSVRREYEIAGRPELAGLTPEESVAVYRGCIEGAVRIRLRADVPVGTCLSGGLDSSAVASIAAGPYRESRGERFRAITAVSEEAANDESPYAHSVAERSDLNWVKVRPTYEDFAEALPDIVRTQEEPFGGPSICMQWFVMRTAREQGIPVMLDGQGGDETLLGYRRYFAAFMLDRLRTDGLRRMVRELADCRRGGAQMGTMGILASMLVQGLPSVAYLKFRLRARWMRSPPSMPDHLRTEAAAMRSLGGIQRFDIERSNLPALLRFEDKNSMRFAVETRLPFLDWRSVETALSLPAEAKFRQGWTKWVLRMALADRLPGVITWRRWKIGFEAPAATWMARHAKHMQEAVEGSALIGELSRPGWLGRHYGSMHAATRWRLFSVALWEREFRVG